MAASVQMTKNGPYGKYLPRPTDAIAENHVQLLIPVNVRISTSGKRPLIAGVPNGTLSEGNKRGEKKYELILDRKKPS
jgi:hypothetical protein